jgi:predicted nucleic acid-binding protein
MIAKNVETCFIDTNIWLYAFVESEEKEKTSIARELIRLTQPIISTQVVNEVCVNLIQKAQFNEVKIAQLIKAFYAKYGVIEIGREVMLAASNLRRKYSLSFWDSTIVASGLMANTAILYSEDLQNRLRIEGIMQIINPFSAR